MMIGADNAFVCGTDDHGSNSEVAAKKQGITTQEFIEQVHSNRKNDGPLWYFPNVYTGTSGKTLSITKKFVMK